MGSLAALVQLVLLTFSIEVLRLPALVASTLALSVAVCVNYGLQKRVTFRSKSKHRVAGPRFLVITLGTLLANAAVFGSLSSFLPYLLSQIITLGAIFPVNYYMNRTITFQS